MKFDVIDTSNLADHVGLLNLLVAGSPRLTPTASSKLFASTMLWCSTKKPALEFITISLQFDVAMAPSVLGLRLISSDMKETANLEEARVGIQTEKLSVWQPSLVPIPPLKLDTDNVSQTMKASEGSFVRSEACAVTRSLCELASVCCFVPLVEPSDEDADKFHMATVATLASLVHNLCESRVLLASGQSPEDMVLEICKQYCVSFLLEAEVVLRQMNPSRGGLVQFTGKTYSPGCLYERTPTLQILILHKSLVPERGLIHDKMLLSFLNKEITSGKGFRKNKMMSSVHFIDSVRMNDDFTTSFLLPDNHGLTLCDWVVTQIDLGALFDHSWSSLRDLVGFTTSNFRPEENLSKATSRNKTSLDTEGLRIEDFREFDDMFVGYIQFDGSPEGLFTKYYQQAKGKLPSPSLAVDVGFSRPDLQWVTFRFPSPITPEGSTFHLLQAKSMVKCKFRKTTSWPS